MRAFWRELKLKVTAKKLLVEFKAYMKYKTFSALKRRLMWRRKLTAKQDQVCRNHSLIIKRKFLHKMVSELKKE